MNMRETHSDTEEEEEDQRPRETRSRQREESSSSSSCTPPERCYKKEEVDPKEEMEVDPREI
eukprot:2404126-Karenia_brevis.AAC.1